MLTLVPWLAPLFRDDARRVGSAIALDGLRRLGDAPDEDHHDGINDLRLTEKESQELEDFVTGALPSGQTGLVPPSLFSFC